MAADVNYAFNAKADPVTGTMQISLIKDGTPLGSVEIDSNKASSIAATLLGSARAAYDLSGKPPPRSDPSGVDLTATSCSGWNIGPGRTEKSVMLIFYFGDTVLGIEVPQTDARLFGQRLLTLGAEGSAQ